MGLRTKIKKIFYTSKFMKLNYSLEIKKKNILITGANSGIGLALTKMLLELDNSIIATYRENYSNLKEIKNKNLVIIKFDQKKTDISDEFKNELEKKSINLIFNCAGTFGGSFDDQKVENLDFKKFLEVITVNAISILSIVKIILNNKNTQNYLEYLVNISSDAGSIKLNNQGNAYIYRTSKSALNSLTKNMSCDLKNKLKTNVFAIDPGYVKTGMNPAGLMNADTCAKLIIDLISRNHYKLNGKFVNLKGEEIDW